MGSTVNGIYVPDVAESGWGTSVSNNMRRLADVGVNVKAYGAVGDGSADDSTSFASARDTAGDGGTVFIPAGTYRLDSLDVRAQGTIYSGVGKNSTILKAKSGADAVFKIGPDNVNGRYWSTFQHLTIDGNAKASDGMWITGPTQGHLFADVWFQNCDICVDFRKGNPDQADKMKFISTRFRDSNSGLVFGQNGTGTGANYDNILLLGFSFDTVTTGIDMRVNGSNITLMNGQFQGGTGGHGINNSGFGNIVSIQDVIFERVGGIDIEDGVIDARQVTFASPVKFNGSGIFRAAFCTFNNPINAVGNDLMFYDFNSTYQGTGASNPTGSNNRRYKFDLGGYEMNLPNGEGLQFGGPNAGAMDAGLYRTGAAALSTESSLAVGSSLAVSKNVTAGDASGQGSISINAASGSGTILFLQKAGANKWHIARTSGDDRFSIVESGVAEHVSIPVTTGAVQLLTAGAFVEVKENGTTDAAAGAANTARLYCKDNGAGKTQLCVRFNTGAVQVIATEP